MQNSVVATPFHVGPVEIRNRAILAPMSGVTDLPFRRLAWRFGAGLVVTEMVASRELVCDSRESWVRLQGFGITPHMVQLAGREEKWMREAAIISEANGADIIDINMGCPAKKVTGGYAGSALMRDPDLALRLIEATVQAVKVPVTVKMRLGWDEQSINAPMLARNAQEAGAQMITVHGRTRNQFYKGRANWSAIRAVRDVIDIPLVANGDVVCRQDVDEILRITDADAVMIGRGAQGQPWVVGRLAGDLQGPGSVSEIVDLVAEHYDAALEHHGLDVGVRQFRKHLGWYLDRFAQDCPAELRTLIMTNREPSTVISCFRQALQTNGRMPVETREAA